MAGPIERLEPRRLLAATVLTDVEPGLAGSDPGLYATLDDVGYFVAKGSLYRTDDAGVSAVAEDGAGGVLPGSIVNLHAAAEVLFLEVELDITVGRSELWRSDGTAAGTSKVADIAAAPRGTGPAALRAWDAASIGDTIVFNADGPAGVEPWVSDGTAAGTGLLSDIMAGAAGSGASDFTRAGDHIVFLADDGFAGRELWRTDLTPAGTTLLADLTPGLLGTTGATLREADGTLAALWTPSGLSMVDATTQTVSSLTGALTPPVGLLAPSDIVPQGSWMYFLFGDSLVRTDGTALGTGPVAVVPQDTRPPELVALDGGLLAMTGSSVLGGGEVWLSDGTTAGTREVDLIDGLASTAADQLTAVADVLFFAGETAETGRELFLLDPGHGVLRLADDVRPGSDDSGLVGLAASGDRVTYFANDGVTGLEPHETTLPFSRVDASSRKLRVQATDFNDSVRLDIETGSVSVEVNGEEEVHSLALIDGFEVYLGLGHDRFEADPDDTRPVYALGAAGDDTMIGGGGRDTLTGSAGRNRVWGRDGDDRLNGSGGRDFLRGDGGNDRIYGRGGSDDLSGDSGVDRLFGGDGNDFMKGGSSNDKLYGEAGDDTLIGSKHDDLLNGGEGNDFLAGSEGRDTLDAGAGDDLLYGDADPDLMLGGSGNDSIFAVNGDADTLSGGSGTDLADLDDALDIVYAVEGETSA